MLCLRVLQASVSYLKPCLSRTCSLTGPCVRLGEQTSARVTAEADPARPPPAWLSFLVQQCLYSTAMTVSDRVDLGTLGRVGTALADPTRRRVLVHLIDGPGYPAEMAGDFGTTRANLSNHLACLRECGLVTATAEGRRLRYELADQRLADGLRILAALDLPGTCSDARTTLTPRR